MLINLGDKIITQLSLTNDYYLTNELNFPIELSSNIYSSLQEINIPYFFSKNNILPVIIRFTILKDFFRKSFTHSINNIVNNINTDSDSIKILVNNNLIPKIEYIENKHIPKFTHAREFSTYLKNKLTTIKLLEIDNTGNNNNFENFKTIENILNVNQYILNPLVINISGNNINNNSSNIGTTILPSHYMLYQYIYNIRYLYIPYMEIYNSFLLNLEILNQILVYILIPLYLKKLIYSRPLIKKLNNDRNLLRYISYNLFFLTTTYILDTEFLYKQGLITEVYNITGNINQANQNFEICNFILNNIIPEIENNIEYYLYIAFDTLNEYQSIHLSYLRLYLYIQYNLSNKFSTGLLDVIFSNDFKIKNVIDIKNTVRKLIRPIIDYIFHSTPVIDNIIYHYNLYKKEFNKTKIYDSIKQFNKHTGNIYNDSIEISNTIKQDIYNTVIRYLHDIENTKNTNRDTIKQKIIARAFLMDRYINEQISYSLANYYITKFLTS